MPQRATLYFHAIIHTMDERLPLADALVIQGDRIAMIGHVHDLEDALPPGTVRIDLEGQSVVPGFNDCHAHILGFGLSLNEANVSVDAVSSIPETVDVLRRRLVSTGEHEWLIGRGYDQNMLAEHRHPNRNDLDAATSQRPIVLAHTSGHVLTCNSAALERAGITAGTPDPPGGEIERDEHGVPTGVLKETATQLVNRMIPEPSAEQGAAAIVRAMQVMAGFGITSATDAATGQGTSAEPQLEMYRSALSSGKLAGRISLVPRIEYVAPPDTGEIHAKHEFDAGDQPEWLAISGAKIFSDGAMSTRTAALRSPYADDAQNYGILLWETPVLLNMMRRAHTAGWQIVTHALGDRAVETVLDCYQQVLTGDHHGEHRHRIEHCMVADVTLARRFRELGIVPVLQPDIHRLGDGYIAALGMERASQVIPMQLFDTMNIQVAFSSDCPVIPCNPLHVIRSAMERQTPAGIVLGPEHRVSALQALQRYTVGGACATRTEAHKGRLRTGMFADFTVLSADPAMTSPEDFQQIRVTRTVTGGEVRYQA